MKIRENNSIKVFLKFFYVDDVRLVVAPLPQGWRWVGRDRQTFPPAHEEEGSFQFLEEWKLLDMAEGKSDLERTAREIKSMMNSKEDDLRFTVELAR